jgi:uncharacterized protein YggL (DUF469 family)
MEVFKFMFNLILGQNLPEERLAKIANKLNKKMLTKEYQTFASHVDNKYTDFTQQIRDKRIFFSLTRENDKVVT